MASPAGTKQKVPVTVEVCLKTESSAAPALVKEAVEAVMKDRSVRYCDGPLQVDWCADEFLFSNVASIVIANTDEHVGPGLTGAGMLLFWQIQLRVMVYQLCEEGAAEDAEGEDEMAMYREWALPAREFHHMWEALLYESAIKRRLLKYSASALLFADRHVDAQLVAWNRVVLLHGPPGTGKTSLCKALAQKLAIKFSSRFPQSQLIEVNAHSLFSKWFSESGKLVTKLFSKIGELVEDQESLVFVLIDEVESLTAARNAAVSGTEPSDAIRVVNALLTQIDALKQYPNVMVLTTTNITQAIDLAFVDRADIKVYIGPPNAQARYEILRSCVNELLRAGIIIESADYELPYHRDLATSGAELDATLSPMNLDSNNATSGDLTTSAAVTSQLCGSMLMEIANMCEGFSGRILRKLPFLAHTHLVVDTCSCQEYMQALKEACMLEREDRGSLA